MNKQFTLQDFVRIFSIVVDEFYQSTVIGHAGMSSEEFNQNLNIFAEVVYANGKISVDDRDNFLRRHELGIGIPTGIPPRMDFPSIVD